MSVIEQASKRLEQLGHAGFSLPGTLAHLKVVDGAATQAARLRAAAASGGHLAERARALADNANAAGDANTPVHFSPALTRAVPVVAAKAGIAVAELARTEPARTEPARTELARTELAGAELAGAEPAMARSVAAVEEPVVAPLAVVHQPAPIETPAVVAADELPSVIVTTRLHAAALPAASPAVAVAAPAATPVTAPAAAVHKSVQPEDTPVAAVASAIPRVEPTWVAQALPIAPKLAAERAEPSTHVSFDLERLRAVGYLVPDQVRSEMAEQFRHLKRPLLKNARAKSQAAGLCASHIMITSALPGEGKTFSSINLAMSMAMEVDTAVLLIDADVVRPSVFNRLGINIKPPGLLDLLTHDDLPLHEALVSTNVPKLHLMGSGERNQRSTELLASTAMDRLLARLSSEYPDHVVIFDAPPLLLTNESPVLATKVGQVVVVVEAMKTRRSVVQQAFAALKNCPVVHSVLNKCDEATEGRRYGYYYG